MTKVEMSKDKVSKELGALKPEVEGLYKVREIGLFDSGVRRNQN